jgi:SAM-dependent methyltransferase
MLTGNVLTMLIGLGQRTGLFDAAAQGPATSAELAARAGLDERYVREWLGAMVTGAIFEYDAGRYVLPAEHAVLLTGPRASNIGPAVGTLRTLSAVLPAVERCFTEGGGVPYAQYAEAAGDTLGDSWRYIYDEQLIDGFLGRVPGLPGRLEAGARVLDLGCGSGHAVNLMAQAYPRSRFTGLDIAPGAIARGEAERAALALGNASFTVADAAALPADPPFDVITAFDAVHDQRSPEIVLAGVHDALAPGGVFVMVDAEVLQPRAGERGQPACGPVLRHQPAVLRAHRPGRGRGGPGRDVGSAGRPGHARRRGLWRRAGPGLAAAAELHLPLPPRTGRRGLGIGPRSAVIACCLGRY